MAMKKGSKEAKAWGARMKRLRNRTSTKRRSSKTSRTIKRGVSRVARKRRATKVKRRRYSRIKNDEKLKVILPAGFGYGLVREYASDKLTPLTNKIPLGNISDEVAMIGILYGLRKWVMKKKGLLRDVAKGGLYVESARIGQATKDGQLGGIFNFGSSGTTTSGSVPIV